MDTVNFTVVIINSRLVTSQPCCWAVKPQTTNWTEGKYGKESLLGKSTSTHMDFVNFTVIIMNSYGYCKHHSFNHGLLLIPIDTVNCSWSIWCGYFTNVWQTWSYHVPQYWYPISTMVNISTDIVRTWPTLTDY
jgi:hypothetical protein